DVVRQVIEQGADYGKSGVGAGKRALVEFVSANPTGPMHIGNARGGALGDSLASLLTAAGFETEREFYINDAGNQIVKFGLSLSIRYLQHFGKEIEMPEDSYHGQDIIDHAAAFAELNGDKYVNCTEEERRKALVAYALPLNVQGLEKDLASYRIHYDTWFAESSLHNSGAVSDILEKLKDSGNTYEKDGATWFAAERFGCDKDFVLIRSNGLPTYIVPDIAYHYNKLVVRGFDIAIDVLGADHHGYVPRMKAALAALGIDPARLVVVLMQMVNLVRNGETVKLSKRSGKAITLVTLLEEVPLDSARFFFIMREPNTHCDFDLDLAVREDSDNPVYYCQYAHARICSIMRRLGEKGEANCEAKTELLREDSERDVIRIVGELQHVVERAAAAYDPSSLARYALELSGAFHRFYNSCRVETDDPELTAARVALCRAVATVLEIVLGMINVACPDRM
nr:arginine--tRNA ligase [Clostridia bacterium]